jgi:hypothetical protein
MADLHALILRQTVVNPDTTVEAAVQTSLSLYNCSTPEGMSVNLQRSWYSPVKQLVMSSVLAAASIPLRTVHVCSLSSRHARSTGCSLFQCHRAESNER